MEALVRQSNTENKYTEPYTALQFNNINEETVLKSEAGNNINGSNNIMGCNSKAELSKEGHVHYSETEQSATNEDVIYHKSLCHETNVKQKMDKLHLPVVVKVENTENQSDLSTISNFMEATVAEFYIKTEEIEIKSEDVMGSDYEVVVDKESENMQSCQLCTFTTRSENLFDRRLLIHNNLQDCKRFSCTHCPYKSKHMCRLREHLLKHKDKSEIVTFNCDQCSYKAKRKTTLKGHLLKHKDKSEIVTFNCAHCPYKAKTKGVLKYHLLIHKDISEIQVTFSCDQCPYKAKRKSSLKEHLLTHRDTSEIVMFNCNQCSYMAKRKSNYNAHMIMHKSLQGCELFNCAHCPYKTRQKTRLRDHLLQHKDI